MLALLLLFVQCLLANCLASSTGATTSLHTDVPSFFYSAVTSFEIRTHVTPPLSSHRRRLRTKVDRAPYGTYVELSFGVEGRVSRNYTNLLLELNDDILSPDYTITLDGKPMVDSAKSTAYRADLPNSKGWVLVTLVPNQPKLFHAFVYHHDEADLLVVEPYATSELSRTSSNHDDNPTHRRLRADANVEQTVVAYFHGRNVHPAVRDEKTAGWHSTRRILTAMSSVTPRSLNAMGKPVRDSVATYKGVYGKASGCPATQQKLTIGMAADAGFYIGVNALYPLRDSQGADNVAAYINNVINMANVIYADQFNVFLAIGEYIMYSGTSLSPTWAGGSWNQAPLDASQAAGNGRSDYGCALSRMSTDDVNIFPAMAENKYQAPNGRYSCTGAGTSCNVHNANSATCLGQTDNAGNTCIFAAADSDPGVYLTTFKLWTNNEMSAQTGGRGDDYGLWHLFTNCFPPAGTVGLASMRATCRTINSGWSTLTDGTWETFTHEIGHNFGAPHTFGKDQDSCDDPDGGNLCATRAGYLTWTVTFPSKALGKTLIGTSVSQPGYIIWTMTIPSKALAATAVGASVTQPGGYMIWTVTITAATQTAAAVGTAVTQTGTNGVGTLYVALDGSPTTTITIRSDIGQTFDDSAELTIDKNYRFGVQYYTQIYSSLVSTVTPDTITSATLTGTTGVGTLAVALDGSPTTTITFRSDIGQIFDGNAELMIDKNYINGVQQYGQIYPHLTFTVPSETITSATFTGTTGVGLLAVALDGSPTTTLTFRSTIGQTFDDSAELVIERYEYYTIAGRAGRFIRQLPFTLNQSTFTITSLKVDWFTESDCTAMNDATGNACIYESSGAAYGGIMSYDRSPEFIFTEENPYDVCTHIADSRSQDGTNSGIRVVGSVCFQDFVTGTCGNFLIEPGEDCDGGPCCTDQCIVKETAHCDYEKFYLSSDGTTIKSNKNECCTSLCKPSGTQLCADGTGFCRNGNCELTVNSIDADATNSNRANWCYYSNFEMCDHDDASKITEDACKVRCQIVDSGACKSIEDLAANYGPGTFGGFATEFKEGDVCETDSSGTYKECSSGSCVDAVDPTMNTTVPPPPEVETITVSTPLSSWTAGVAASVSWESSAGLASSEQVSITLKNNGVLVSPPLLASTENDGTQSVTTNSSITPGTQYHVCVTQVSDTSVTGCAGPFIVLAAPSVDSVTLSSQENGGGVVVGGAYNILWTTTGSIANVKITLYHNDVYKRTIIASTSNNDNTLHTWTVPTTDLSTGTGYSIRVSNTVDSSNYALSSIFNIDAVSKYTITTPSNATVWVRTEVASILWTSAGSAAFQSGEVKIDIGRGSVDSVAISTISTSTPNDGQFAITGSVTNALVAADDYWLKIRDVTTGEVSYTTNGGFTLSDPGPDPSITATAPTQCTAGQSCNLTWTTTGSVGNTVTIKLIQSGKPDITIHSTRATSSGTFTWSIPSWYDCCRLGTSYIRVTDVSNSDVTDLSDAMEILIAPSLAITDINPTSSWIRGDSAQVQWTTSGNVGNIDVLIRKSGITDISITGASGTTNDGSHTITGAQTTALTVGAGYSIVLKTSTAFGVLESTLSASFAVVDPKTITVSNAPTDCVIGSACSIVWDTTGSVGTVRITFSGNGIVGTIVASTQSSPYSWTVLGIPAGNDFTVRVESTSDNTIVSTSPSFTIAAQASLSVLAPASGTQWITGQTGTVTWSAQGSAGQGTITITLKHATASDKVLATGIANDGSYTVTSSQTTSIVAQTGYTIHVDSSGGGGITATSSGTFSVHLPPQVSVDNTDPAKCIIGSTCNIKFTMQGLVSNVKIMYFKGTNNGVIVASTSTSPYVWTVPNSFAPGAYSIRIEDVDDVNVNDMRTLALELTPSITVVAPSVTTKWTTGNVYTIDWTSTGTLVTPLILTLKRNGVSDVILSSTESNDGSYEVSSVTTSELVAATGYTIEIKDSAATAATSANFAVVNTPPAKTVSMQAATPSPCVQGVACNIGYNVTGGVSGISMAYLGASSGSVVSSTTDNPFAWTVPLDVVPGVYYVTGVDSNDDTVSGITPSFTIESAPNIIIQYPSSTTQWIHGNIGEIRWNKVGTTSSVVTISILRSGMNPINEDTDNDGEYNFPISVVNGLTANGGYTVQISVDNVIAVTDAFSVVLADNVIVGSMPQHGCTVGGESHCVLPWVATGTVTTVKISIVRISGSSTVSTVLEASTATNPYLWSIPNSFSPTGTYSVHMEDTRSSSVADTGMAFEIHAPPSVTVTSPTNGQIWQKTSSPSTFSIEWITAGSISLIDIILKRNGSNDVLLASSTTNNGFHVVESTTINDWSASSGYTITVREAVGLPTLEERVEGISGAFSIVDEDTVGVSDINSTDGCVIGTQCPIIFEMRGNVVAVKIMYQQGTNNGVIVASTSTSPYVWTPTTLGEWQIRVEDASDASVHAVSSTFTVYPTPSIRLLLPLSSTSWTQGKTASITWTSGGKIGSSLTFTLMRDGMENKILASGEGNDGVLTVQGGAVALIPAGTGYTVMVDDGAGNQDVSGAFQILSGHGVAVVSPGASSVCVVGSACTISWEMTGSVTSVDIEYTGMSEGAIKQDATTSPITWTVPLSLAEGEYFVRIIGKGVDVANGVEDTSSGFQITLQMSTVITSPNSKDVWVSGKGPFDIAWTVSNANDVSPTDSNVQIELLNSAGTAVIHTIGTALTPTKASGSTSSQAEYTYEYSGMTLSNIGVNPPVESLYRVRMIKGEYTATSSAFTIRPAPTISVSSPVSGVNVFSGQKTTVTYSKIGAVGSVKIELLRNGGQVLIITNSWSDANNFEWSVPPKAVVALGSSYAIRVVSVSDPTIFSDSGTFTIMENNAITTITSPSKGSTVVLGVPSDVLWAYTGTIDHVQLILKQSGVSNRVLSSSEICDGSYVWMTTTDGTGPSPGSGYTLTIEDVTDATNVHWTSGQFTIAPAKKLIVTSPTSATTITEGKIMTVTWDTESSVPNVKITLRNSQNSFKHVLIDSTDNDGVHDVTISSSVIGGVDPFSGATYDVLVETSGNEVGVVNIPSALFTIIRDISSDESLQVRKPATGEVVTAGTLLKIEWEYAPSVPSFTKMKIELYHAQGCLVSISSTCMVLVSTLSTTAPHDGSYLWNTTEMEAAGDRYIIRVTPIDGNRIVSVSESGEFSFILPSPTLAISSIFSTEEGAVWEKGSTETVRWTGTHGAGDSGIRIYLLGCSKDDLLCAITTTEFEITGSASSLPKSPATSFAWTVPFTSPPKAKESFVLEIRSVEYSHLRSRSAKFQIYDASCPLTSDHHACNDDRVFTVTSPSSSTTSPIGTRLRIEWSVSGANRDPRWSEVGVEITLRGISSSGGSLIAGIIAQTENTGLYDWVSYFFFFCDLLLFLLLLFINLLFGHMNSHSHSTSSSSSLLCLFSYVKMSPQIIPDTGLPLDEYVIQVVPVDETFESTKRISCPLSSSTTQCKSGDFSVISTIGGPTLEVSIESTLWEIGSSQTFEWEGKNLNGEVVNIYIRSLDETSPADEYLILTAGKSSGKIQYIVPSEIQTTYPTKGYVLEARSEGVLSAVSVSFAVVAGTTLHVIKPSNTNPHYKGSQYEIEWTSTGVPFDIVVRLYSTGSTKINSQRVTKSDKACAFPFTYLGVHQTDCVHGGGHGVGFTEWCPTKVTGSNNDPGETEECTPLSLIGQLNPNDGILYTPGTLPATMSPYSSSIGKFRWSIAEIDLPSASHGYYIEITKDPQQSSSEQLAGQQQFQFKGSRSNSFEISCAWYRAEITLSKNAQAPEGANHVVTEIARVTGLQENNIDVVEIGTLNPIVIVVDLQSSSDNMNLKKCPIAGLSGLFDYKDSDSQIVPIATRIDFSATTSQTTECNDGFWKNTAKGPDACDACADIENKASNETVTCTSATTSQISACKDGFWKNTANAADTCDVCTATATAAACVAARSTSPDAPKYIVSHRIFLEGVGAKAFNNDLKLVQSFREAVAKTLGVPAADVINIRAISTVDGVLRCTVVYDIRVVSSADITAMENTMKEKYADMKSSMVSNQVTSINPEDIVVNTSADADVETNNDGTAESMEIIIDLTQLVTVLGVALVILIVILLLRVCVKRKPKTKSAPQTETDLEPVDNPMSFINIEMTKEKSNDQRKLATGTRHKRQFQLTLLLPLLFACCLLGSTQGSFVKVDSGLCSALTNGFVVKNLADCGRASVALFDTPNGTNAELLPSDGAPYGADRSTYPDKYPAGCFYATNFYDGMQFMGNMIMVNNKWTATSPCSSTSSTTPAECICWVGVTCEKTTVGADINPTECMCGTKICDDDTGRFCQSSINKCSQTEIIDACTTTDGSSENSENCACGSSNCDASTGRFCNLASNTCTKTAACTVTDGNAVNPDDCACGSAFCDASTGRFCSSSINKCSNTSMCSKDSDCDPNNPDTLGKQFCHTFDKVCYGCEENIMPACTTPVLNLDPKRCDSITELCAKQERMKAHLEGILKMAEEMTKKFEEGRLKAVLKAAEIAIEVSRQNCRENGYCWINEGEPKTTKLQGKEYQHPQSVSCGLKPGFSHFDFKMKESCIEQDNLEWKDPVLNNTCAPGWSGKCNHHSLYQLIKVCDDPPQQGTNGNKCEVGGFLMKGEDYDDYYSKVFMDDVRNNCKQTCKTCQLDSGQCPVCTDAMDVTTCVDSPADCSWKNEMCVPTNCIVANVNDFPDNYEGYLEWFAANAEYEECSAKERCVPLNQIYNPATKGCDEPPVTCANTDGAGTPFVCHTGEGYFERTSGLCTDDGGSYIGTKEACDENREAICNSVPGYYGAGRCKSIADIGTVGSTLPSDYEGNEGDEGVARPSGCYVKENGDIWFNPTSSTEPCSVDRKCLCKKTCQADTCKPKPFDVTCASQIVDNKAVCTKTECCNIIGYLPVIPHFVIKESQNIACGALTNGFQVDNTDDCGTGSAAVGWSDTTPTVADKTRMGIAPPGCYFKQNGDENEKLLFLPSDSTGSCSSGEACLCWVGEACSNTEGASVNHNTDCMCGTKICDADAGRFCRSSMNKCSESKINDPCTFVDGNIENFNDCTCGVDNGDDCTETTGRFCTWSLNSCSKNAPCTETDGTVANTNDCTCGTADCDASTGRFCTSSLNFCYTNNVPEDVTVSGSTFQPAYMGKYTWSGSNFNDRPYYEYNGQFLYWLGYSECACSSLDGTRNDIPTDHACSELVNDPQACSAANECTYTAPAECEEACGWCKYPNLEGYDRKRWYIGTTLGITGKLYWKDNVLRPEMSPKPTVIRSYNSDSDWGDDTITIAGPTTCATTNQGGPFDCAGETNPISLSPANIKCTAQNSNGCVATECCIGNPKTCADITGAQGGVFDCYGEINSINLAPAGITCAAQASGCTATECCTVVPKTCADTTGAQGGAFDCASHVNAINAAPAGITCAAQASGCTATECCTVVPKTTCADTDGAGTSFAGCTGEFSTLKSTDVTCARKTCSIAECCLKKVYIVIHKITLTNVEPNSFNDNKDIKQAFKETVSKLLKMDMSRIENVRACRIGATETECSGIANGNDRRRTDDVDDCEVRYDIISNNPQEMNAVKNDITSSSYQEPASFSNEFKTSLRANNVDDAVINAVSAQTDSTVQEEVREEVIEEIIEEPEEEEPEEEDARSASSDAPKYVVSHHIVLEGVGAKMFNNDLKLVQSFREAVAKTLGVPAVYVINIRAVSTRRALDATLRHVDRQHRRTLDGVLRCTVVYDLRVVSSADITAMENTMKEKYADSEIFLTNMKSSMVSNQVTSINPEDIVVNTSADTSADVETNNNDGTEFSVSLKNAQNLKELAIVLGVLLVVAILILLLCVCVKRKTKSAPKTDAAAVTGVFGAVGAVGADNSMINIEMTNPIESTSNKEISIPASRRNNHGRTAKNAVQKKLVTGTRHKRHETDEGKVFYEDVDRPGVTSWKLPEGGKLVSSRSSRSIKKKGRGRGKKSKGLKKSSSHGESDGSSDKEKGSSEGASGPKIIVRELGSSGSSEQEKGSEQKKIGTKERRLLLRKQLLKSNTIDDRVL